MDSVYEIVWMRNEAANALWGDLDKLHKWSKDWNMPFNMDNCAVMHVGRKNCR